MFFNDRKKTVVLLVLLITVSQVASIIVPFVTKNLIDALTAFIKKADGVIPWHTLIWCAVGILVFSLISSILESLYNYHLFLMTTKVEDKVRRLAFERYLQLHSLFHHGASSGQVIGRIERGGVSFYLYSRR